VRGLILIRAVNAVTLGRAGPGISRAGLGLMGMPGPLGPAPWDALEAMATPDSER
jgi:hypothetical protein